MSCDQHRSLSDFLKQNWDFERFFVAENVLCCAIEEDEVVHDTENGVVTEVRDSSIACTDSDSHEYNFDWEDDVAVDQVCDANIQLNMAQGFVDRCGSS